MAFLSIPLPSDSMSHVLLCNCLIVYLCGCLILYPISSHISFTPLGYAHLMLLNTLSFQGDVVAQLLYRELA